ncbi:hypothetical protein VNO78_25825 [Psophocarpus tetragonolobus]|uniref:PUM-HD domain-containing protein n=1 Tax=Psophocarpus tetragonolobus TaxID=3891 RepID=A0AAN9S7U0_PSOTE
MGPDESSSPLKSIAHSVVELKTENLSLDDEDSEDGPTYMHQGNPPLNLTNYPIEGFQLPQGCEQLLLSQSNASNVYPFRLSYVYGPNYMHQVLPPQNLHHPGGGFSFPQLCDQQVMSNSNPRNLDARFERNYVSMAKNPNGSLSLQNRIDVAPPREIKVILNQIRSHLHELMNHPFGHRFIRKLFESTNVNFEQKKNIIESIISNSPMLVDAIMDIVVENFLDIATDENGVRVIKACIKITNWPLEAFHQLVQKIISNVVDLAEDKYGVHAAIIARELMRSPQFVDVLKNPNGIRVVLRALEYTQVCHLHIHV